ncbi:hypothetical protein ACFSO0_15255 [Brevibacillus sp. GCM10020057]|uniref:hypothetical protein n=1 Tax=Brevibacillus sp. GCM10020057 TaxID=3317327 RepID=UPI003633FD86
MKSSLRACLLTIVVACMVVTGCAQNTKITEADMKNRIETELDTVERVSVMSTDGQEVSLDLRLFLSELHGQGKDLQLSDEPLKQEDVKFTLVLYRKQLAPLVVSVGEKASQFGESTYRGPGAITFYQWIHRLTGKGLMALQEDSILLNADDLSESRTLSLEEAGYIQKVLREAVPESDKNEDQQPLYPHYRLRINSGERPMEVTVLTPTLISVPFGRDTHYFQVDGTLFSRLTEYLVPREMTSDPIEKLFKATNIRVDASGQMPVDNIDLDVTQSTVEQGLAHQTVRLLKTGVPLPQPPQQSGLVQYKLHFRVSGEERTVTFYSLYFQIDDQWYSHNQLQKTIWKWIASAQK